MLYSIQALWARSLEYIHTFTHLERVMMKQKSSNWRIVSAWSSVIGIMALVLISGATGQENSSADPVSKNLERIAQDQVSSVVKSVYFMCRAQHEYILMNVQSNLNVARYVASHLGKFSLSQETAYWNEIDQITKAPKTVELPKFLIGDQWLGQNHVVKEPSLIVDEVAKLVGGTCTIFQRINQAGDMLRVCTNVENSVHERAIGTYIPATEPSGLANPVVSTVLGGHTYRGRAFVVDSWYLTAYEPILNPQNEVIGMLYVGVNQESVQSLRKGIMDITLGKNGYVYVLGGHGDTQGVYQISHRGEQDGQSIWEAKDDAGNLVIQDVYKRLFAAPVGEVVYCRYPWKNPGEDAARMKIGGFIYFPEWDWVVVASVYESDFIER